MNDIIWLLLIGLIAGWLGSVVYKGSGLGLVGNIIVGILGSFVGGKLLSSLGTSMGGGVLGSILTGALGAIIILVILNLIFRRRA